MGVLSLTKCFQVRASYPFPRPLPFRIKRGKREIGLVGTVERQGCTKARATFPSATRAHVFLSTACAPELSSSRQGSHQRAFYSKCVFRRINSNPVTRVILIPRLQLSP